MTNCCKKQGEFMQKFLHIKPSFDALVEMENKTFEMNKNKISTLLFSSDSPVAKIKFYPLDNKNKTSIPFGVVLNFDTCSLLTSCENHCKVVTLTKYPHDNILLEVEPFLLYDIPFGEHKKEVICGDENCTIFYTRGDSGMVKVESKTDTLQFKFSKGIVTLNARANKEKILIWVENLNKKNSIAQISLKNGKFELTRLENVDILEENDKVIKTLRNLHTVFHHGIVGEYGSNLVGKYKLAKMDDKIFSQIDEKLVPYYFLDAVRVKDFDLAKSFLSPALSNVLDNNHLEKFFGDFKNFGQNLGEKIFPEDIAIFYEENDIQVAKLFHFELKDGKIENIAEL